MISLSKRIIYCGEPVVLACDGQCNKAWGINSRPTHLLSNRDDDWEYLADGELAEAPADPGTYESGHAKPIAPSERLNRWCCRECERSDFATYLDDVNLKDFSKRVPNRRDLHPPTEPA